MKTSLTDNFSDTYHNSSGYILYLELKSKSKIGEEIQLSFLGVTSTSTSFLNSSFGSLIEDMGLEKFLSFVKPSEITLTQASMLKLYIQGFPFETKP